MKKIILSGLLTLLSVAAASAVSFPQAQYNYDIRYRWGLIDETAAHATATVSCSDNQFFGILAGRSIDWEGRYYEVTDTLSAIFTPTPEGFPAETVHQCIGWYRKPTVDMLRSGAYDPDVPQNFMNTAGQGSLDASESTMNNIFTTANLLATYYYAAAIDFDTLTPGRTFTAQAGPNVTLTATYNGVTQWNGQPVRDFTFTYSGADVPVRCLIDADARIPVLFRASLIIGDLEMSLI